MHHYPLSIIHYPIYKSDEAVAIAIAIAMSRAIAIAMSRAIAMYKPRAKQEMYYDFSCYG